MEKKSIFSPDKKTFLKCNFWTEIILFIPVLGQSPRSSPAGSVASSSTSPASNRLGSSPRSSPQRSPGRPKPKNRVPIRNPKRNRELASLPRQSDAPKEKERKVAVTEAIHNLIGLNQASKEKPNSNSKTTATPEEVCSTKVASASTSDQIEVSESSKLLAETVQIEPEVPQLTSCQTGSDHQTPSGEDEVQQQPQEKTFHDVMTDKENPKTTKQPSIKGLSDISDETLPPCDDQLKGRLSDLSEDLSNEISVPSDDNNDSNTLSKGVSKTIHTSTSSGLSDISDGDLPPDEDSANFHGKNVLEVPETEIPPRRISALSEMSDGNRALCELVIGVEDEDGEIVEESELLDETLVPNNENSHHDDGESSNKTTEAHTTTNDEIPADEQEKNSQGTSNDNPTISEQPMVTDLNCEEIIKIKSKNTIYFRITILKINF